MEYKGIDISHWNNIKDFDAVKKSGIDFAIIKAGGNEKGKYYRDVNFERNFKGCKDAGIKVGAYYYAKPQYQGNAPDEGVGDATEFIKILTNHSFDMPVYLDFEEGEKRRKVYNTVYCYYFCITLEKWGAFAGIYGSDINTFHDMLYIDKGIDRFSWWVARYVKKPQYATKNMHMHQYSSKGRIDGIIGNVDLNTSYLDFADIIRKKGLNVF